MTSSEERDISLLAFDQYLREVRWLPRLSPEEEFAFYRQMRHGNDAVQARDRLVESFQSLVIHIARQYSPVAQRDGFEPMDLIQYGNLGLLATLDSCQVDSHAHLVGVLGRAIRGAIIRAFHSFGSLVRVSEEISKLVMKLNRTQTRLLSEWGREPSVGELAKVMGLSHEKVADLMWYRTRRTVQSLEGLMREETDRDELESTSTVISAFAVAQPSSDADAAQVQWLIREAFETQLTLRQQEVMRLRLGLDGVEPHSQTLAAQVLGLTSKQSVQGVEYLAKRRLQQVLCRLCLACHGMNRGWCRLGRHRSPSGKENNYECSVSGIRV